MVQSRKLPLKRPVWLVLGLLLVLSISYFPSKTSAATTITVQLAYGAIGGGTGHSGPTFIYVLNGIQRTAQLTKTLSSINIDSGSTWSVSSQLPGSNATVRWATSVTSGVASLNMKSNFTYFYQYALTAGFSVVGGQAPGQPLLRYSSDGTQVVSVVLPYPSEFWVDVGTVYNMTSELPGSTVGERWVVSGPTSGILVSPAALTTVYYHQYTIQVGYSVVGGGSPPAPSIRYTSMGTPMNSTLAVRQTLWADSGTAVSLTSILSGSGSNTRWKLGATIPPAVLNPINSTAVYYFQVAALADFEVLGGGTPSGPGFAFTSLGRTTSIALQTSATAYWLDSGSTWEVQSIIQPSPIERWVAQEAQTTGLAAEPFSLSLTYQHQYRLAVSVGKYGGGQVSNMSGWYSPGESVQLSVTASPGWEFVMWAGDQILTSSPTSVVVDGPTTETAVFYPGLTVEAGNDGSVLVLGEAFSGRATLSHPLVAFVAPGTNIMMLASPSSSIYQFTSWSGLSTTTQNPSSFVLVQPMEISAGFGISYVHIASLMAGVVLIIAGIILWVSLLRHRRPNSLQGFVRRLKLGKR